MCLDLQWKAQGIDDAAVSGSAGNVLHDVSQWHARKVMQCLDDSKAVVERGRPWVLEALLVAGHGERLAVGAGHHQIYRGQSQNVRLVKLCYILWNVVIKATRQDVSPQRQTEIVGVVENHLLKTGECDLACNRVLVAEVYLCHNLASLDERADDLKTGTAAQPKVSDGCSWIQEKRGISRDVLDDREV